MYWRTIPTSKTQLIIGALKFAEFPDYISIDYGMAYICSLNCCPPILYVKEVL